MLTKNIILEELKSHRQELRSCGVKRIGLFGSFARGEQTEMSDIDFLVEFIPNKKNFKNFMRVVELLEALFDRKIELVTPEALSQYIGPRINSEVEYAAL